MRRIDSLFALSAQNDALLVSLRLGTLRCCLHESVKEILSLAESEANWLEQTAQNFEQFAAMLKEEERAEWDLLATGCRERAQIIQRMLGKVREKFAADEASEAAGLENA
jgi:hypothetical protein